jgi:DNA helicase HerA-like ATPase
MQNREVYEQDPKEFQLLNNGVAKVRDAKSKEELETLRFELKTFICEGEYEKGLVRLLQSYLDNLDQPEQPAAWISGFFGSGKSHLVKMLRYLWVDYEFPNGVTARGLANLSSEVEDLLTELSTQARRLNGLHAVSGTLGSGAKGSVRLALLGLIFKSVGLPEKYPLAQFVLWLQQEGIYEEGLGL